MKKRILLMALGVAGLVAALAGFDHDEAHPCDGARCGRAGGRAGRFRVS
jgi:hypothetical protein